MLIIDNREPKVIMELIKSRFPDNKLENLELRDYVFKNKADEIKLIFERKSLNDLIASIKDGRYNEQSWRLSECPTDNSNIFYIIEGNIMNLCNRQSETIQKMLFSSMFSLITKKGFSLIHTSNEIETAEFIIRFSEKADLNKESIENNSYSSTIKMTKKSNITKNNIGEIMLAQIPGVSITVAQCIMNEFSSINNLVINLQNNSDCLDNIKIPFKNGHRKLGKNVVTTIKEFLV